jgi:glycosyltransferase involved in cell wall biosynthesis
MTRSPYDNELSPTNVYGRALELLKQYATEDSDVPLIHLDLACGYAAIASVIESDLGRDYVGVDIDEASVGAVREAGFEAHLVDLEDETTLSEEVRRAVAGRRIGSITFLDGLEHVTNGPTILRLVSSLASENEAVVVLSVPNVTHRDVGYKAALGSWTVTESGLLDRTHVGFYSADQLTSTLRAAGLHRVAENNVETSVTDQHFPSTHPALKPGTTINRVLNNLRDAAEPSGRVQQFVWACLAGPNGARPIAHPERDQVFLTVIVRTQGRRIQELREALLCLAGQSSREFEVIVLAHNTDIGTQVAIEQVIEDQGDDLRERIRLRLVDHGTRATLLNLGFADANGRYVAVLDDDDLVFGHWVESFARLAERQDGTILRSVASAQHAGRVKVRGKGGIRALGEVRMIFAAEFSYVSHLSSNNSPLMSLAFPIGVFRDMGLRFDETLTTTEDWDYLLRAAQITGVSDSRQLTAIYHQWPDEESSHTEHDDEVWRLNQLSIDRKIDSQPILLQAGETRQIRMLVRNAVPQVPYVAPNDSLEREWHLYRLSSLLESNSWRVSQPLRWISRGLGGGRPVKMSEFVLAPLDDISHAVKSIESSRSWTMTRWLRRGPL